MMMKNLILFIGLILTCTLTAYSQTSSKGWLRSEKFDLEPSVGIQLWSSYTMGAKVYNESTQDYEAVDDRLNFQLRRTRFGFKGTAYERLKYNLLFSADGVGRDVLAGTEGGANNTSFPKLGLWNAYVQWQVVPESDQLDIVFGYQVPQIGRESITSAMRSTSMEKAWSQNYLRRHLLGTGPGRATGLNIGGLLLKENRPVNWSYDIGLFNPRQLAFNGQSIGRQYAPLTTARLVLYWGDPETQHYSTGHKVNYFGQRYGLSFALAGAYQGQTDVYQNNTALGTDFLLNWGSWSMDGEWHLLSRTSLTSTTLDDEPFHYDFQSGYLRLSYTCPLPNEHYLEPTTMLVLLHAALDAENQAKAATLGTFSGREQIWDMGVNYYLNPDLKFSLHYTYRKGQAGDTGKGATFNNYFHQPGVGAIQRGNWIGLGLIAVL